MTNGKISIPGSNIEYTPLHIRKQQVKSGHGVLTNVTYSDYAITNRTPSVYVIELVSSKH